MAIQRILVTGGAGFIGSHTVDLLLRHGKQVVVLDNLSSGSIHHLDLRAPELELIEGDVLEYPLLLTLIASCDAVIHLAAIASVPQSIADPIYTFQVNTQGFLHVLCAVQQAKRKVRVVYASSAAVYGEEDSPPCRDDKPLRHPPLSPYALQKLNNEQYADVYARLHGVNSLGLRYFNVYGRGQDPASPYSGVISRFLDAYREDKPLTIFGDGQQSRDFIYVTDIAEANWLALNSAYSGVLNVASGRPETLLNMIDCLEAAGQKPAIRQFESERPGDIKRSYASTQLAEQSLGFKSTVSLLQGMKQLLESSGSAP